MLPQRSRLVAVAALGRSVLMVLAQLVVLVVLVMMSQHLLATLHCLRLAVVVVQEVALAVLAVRRLVGQGKLVRAMPRL